ncbi:hypothetical protein ABJ384_12660 [Acinetobacter sp. A1-4-2]|uniref:Uncharacterized protein n=1 Tax=Acinetobacter sp. A1-4-2 TaxID=3156489 RepID=A0AAU7SVU6_9GAMM
MNWSIESPSLELEGRKLFWLKSSMIIDVTADISLIEINLPQFLL